MDREEIEGHLADYVEGKCDDAVQYEIDEKRQLEPDLDRLVRTHERVLSMLRTTPVAVAPNGLSVKILSAIRRKEEHMVGERKRYHREMMMMVSTGVPAAALFCVFFSTMLDWISTIALTIAGWLNATVGAPVAPAPIIDWLHMVGAILNHPVQVPFLTTSLLMFTIAVTAVLIGLMWNCHDDRRKVGH